MEVWGGLQRQPIKVSLANKLSFGNQQVCFRLTRYGTLTSIGIALSLR
jgi:hypothetical protein